MKKLQIFDDVLKVVSSYFSRGYDLASTRIRLAHKKETSWRDFYSYSKKVLDCNFIPHSCLEDLAFETGKIFGYCTTYCSTREKLRKFDSGFENFGRKNFVSLKMREMGF